MTARLTDLEWMALRVTVLFTHDEAGRLRRTREPRGRVAPRFYLGRSRHGNLWRFRSDLPPELLRELARLASREGPLPDGVVPPERLQAFRDVLERGAPIATEWRGPAFRFPDSQQVTPDGVGAQVVAIDAANRERLRDDFPEYVDELPERLPCLAIEEAGRFVSLCCTARLLPGRGAEAGVETLAGHRGRGYAGRVALAWSRAVAARGVQPFYSTSWDNLASRAVARRLGLVFVGEDLHFD